MRASRLFIVSIILFLSGCTSMQRIAHMFSSNAPSPLNYTFKDGGSSIYYTFTTNETAPIDSAIFFYGGTGCPSWKSVMPNYVNGISVSARVFVLNKRFVTDKSTGIFGCGDNFHKANFIEQWVSDYSEFITAQLETFTKPPKNVVLVGVSEGAIQAVKVAGKMPEISHIAIIGHGGYTMRKSLTTLKQNGKIAFDVNEGWKDIESDPHSIKNKWYGNTYRWWYEILDYNPTPDYLQLDIPILFGIGENDHSVPVESAYHLESEFKKAGKENFTLMVFKGADHRLSDGKKSYRNKFFKLLSQRL